ncbi:hypothetical protein [Stutzerimonas nitrititolerans]|uniref:Uncharacterized protein n=1 Tax=Stutzerimonas nitrititolerans TaxID=2482751 RepID=A0AA41WJD8_9GAMM|nr:hypothetical protein [Stutzerimonas nitrititolerans]AFN79725.1 hypothetical protein PSJM300_18360 [Stutzerimonas stutzeri DSM 10701]KRW67297.1 hypothetical protein AO729_06535 [Pseudomonas sp. TTU2014-066ASC]WAD25498.1 hypothetical protein OS670_13845 [Pseudomonadaceae bacterium T75]SUD86250.1 Uncharacterised protein [Stutzerimonas stutzeri]HAQ24483.1 hypothetical protein [Pseudomonas sp.]
MSTEETAQLRQALEDTIQVLERTRHSFKSRELGQLRRRLLDLLEQLADAEPTQGQRMERRR